MLGLWKRSRLRYYWLNTKWNVGFWLNAKPLYEDKHYHYVDDKALDLDKNLDELNVQFEFDKKLGHYRKFKGYMYRNGLYWDNPGPQCAVDQETRQHWLKKRWI
jgi:hypothetical protein